MQILSLKDPKKSRSVAALFAGLVYLFTNGYRFFQTAFAGDSLSMIYQNDAAWQIALGRFLQPFLVLIRGSITAPFLISSLAICWLMASVYLVADLLDLKHPASLLLTGAVMASSPALISANAAFLPWVDFYCLALFLAVLGAWLLCGEKRIFLPLGALAVAFSLGIYQSYICVTLGLLMLRFLLDTLDEENLKSRLRSILKWSVGLAVGGGLYLLIWKAIQKYRNIWTANTYNGLADVGDYSESSVWSVLRTTYRNVLDSILHPTTYLTYSFSGRDLSEILEMVMAGFGIAALVLGLVLLVLLNIRKKSGAADILPEILVLVLYPLGINAVCFLSKGMEHELMTYGMNMVPLFAILMADRFLGEGQASSDQKGLRKALPKASGLIILCCLTAIVWSRCVFGNQVSLKLSAQEKAVDSLMTRILDRIETFEGYEPGVTPVAFSGNLEGNPYLTQLEGFQGVDLYGVGITTMHYPGTDYAYLKFFELTNLNLTRVPDSDERLEDHPCFPDQGSVFYVDDVLVVKISD